MRWIGVRDEKAVGAGLVPGHHVRRPGQRHLGHVLSARCVAHRSQREHDAQSAVCDVVPPLPVEAITNPVQRPVCDVVPVKRTQRDGDAGESEVQGAVLDAIDASYPSWRPGAGSAR